MFFVRLHPLNLVLALLARLFGPVAYWKCEGVPAWLCAPLTEIDPADFFSGAQWNRILEEAHALLRQQLSFAPKMEVRAGGFVADFGPLWLHRFALQFEAEVQAQELALAWTKKKGLSRCYVVKSGIVRFARILNVYPPQLPAVRPLRGSAFLDVAWEVIKQARQVLAAAVHCVRPRPSSTTMSNVNARWRYLFVGLSPIPYAAKPNRLDFAFLVRRGLLPSRECLYLSARPPSAAELDAFSQTGARWIAASAFPALLNKADRYFLLYQMTAVIVRCLFSGSVARSVSGLAAIGLPWLEFAKSAGAQVFVVSLDQGVVEPCAVPWMRALGIKTILWQHASVGWGHAEDSIIDFRHRMLEQSVFACREICVWTPADRDMLDQRALLPVIGTRMHITGPLMSGDCSWLRRDKVEARQTAGLPQKEGRKIVVVFDLPTHIKGFRRQLRFPIERISAETHDAFFSDVIAILAEFSEIDIVLKPKRGRDPRIYRGPAFENLCDPQGEWCRRERVMLLDHDIDPYLPIAMADLCLGMPFTSPVVAALNGGRPSFWYDPNGFAKRPYPSELNQVLVRGRSHLFERLNLWRRDAPLSAPACLLSDVVDPGVKFATILTASKPCIDVNTQ
jgi:hypothetical protein